MWNVAMLVLHGSSLSGIEEALPRSALHCHLLSVVL